MIDKKKRSIKRINFKVQKNNKRNLPILYVHRSNKHFSVQVVKEGKVLAYSSTLDKKLREIKFDSEKNLQKVKWVAINIAEKLKKINVFDVAKSKGYGKFGKILKNFFYIFDMEIKNEKV